MPPAHAGRHGRATASNHERFWHAGSITSTGIQSNLAIDGNGFFVVKDPVSGNSYVTQDGSFSTDQNGYLVTSGGLRLQGTNGDLQIAGSSTATVSSYTISSNGTVTVNLSDAPQARPVRSRCRAIPTPDKLVKDGNNLYTAPATAGGLAARSRRAPVVWDPRIRLSGNVQT